MPNPELWSFMSDRDRKKLTKAGFATPRGGGKNAYQNHVSRANRVIIPLERMDDVDLDLFADGCVIRLLPEQAFQSAGVLHPQLAEKSIDVGADAFILYRTHADFESDYPPPSAWSPRGLSTSALRRTRGVPDTGEFVVRLSNPKVEQGLPQGIFAPEYANSDDNFLAQALLAWLLGRVEGQPYADSEFSALQEFLDQQDASLVREERLLREGIVVDSRARCPLCLLPLRYTELHRMLDLTEATGLANAGIQVVGATRSTIVNLFHMQPLLYAKELRHKARYVAWGHAICNTLLGQRACIPLQEMHARGFRLLREDGDVWGLAAEDESMLRSDDLGVWARLVERGRSEVPLTEAVGSELLLEDENASNEDDEDG